MATIGRMPRPSDMARHGPDALVDHAMLEETRRDVPRLGAAPDLGAGGDGDADAEQHGAHPVTSRPGRAPAREAIRLPEQREDADREDEQKQRQLAPYQRSGDTERRGDAERARTRSRNRRRNGPECGSRDRIGKRLVQQVRRVRQRRRGHRHDRGRRAPTHGRRPDGRARRPGRSQRSSRARRSASPSPTPASDRRATRRGRRGRCRASRSRWARRGAEGTPFSAITRDLRELDLVARRWSARRGGTPARRRAP